MQPFHLAFPVHDLAAARQFYGDLLGCTEGRSSDEWIDFNLYGHQIVAHLVHDTAAARKGSSIDGSNIVGSNIVGSNTVDHHEVPVPHFGVVLTMHDWQQLAERLQAKGVAFVIAPQVRFAGKTGEQATMFFKDPSGNALEFKAFADPGQLFAK